MNKTKISSKTLFFVTSMIICVFSVYLIGCSNNTTSPDTQTDQQYLQSIVTIGYSSSQTDDDNVMFNERNDMNDGGAVGDNDGGPMNPIDSLKRWGRIVTDVNINFQGTFSGDTMYTVQITRSITGYYRIIGYQNGGIDSVTKPYTETLLRNVIFKRVARTIHPRFNWRLYQVSLLSGNTNTPQNGNTNTQITGIQVNINGTPTYTWSGDFTQVLFTTRFFNGAGIPEVHKGDQVNIIVTVSSTEQNNYVAWHWARNTFGFHRVPFTFVSSTQGGNGFIDIFSKNFTVYNSHPVGSFNGFINASTHESLYDDNPGLFSSTEVGIPYKVLP